MNESNTNYSTQQERAKWTAAILKAQGDFSVVDVLPCGLTNRYWNRRIIIRPTGEVLTQVNYKSRYLGGK